MLLHLHPKSLPSSIHTSPPSLHPILLNPLLSPSHTFPPLLPHVFLFTPPPLKTPSPIHSLPKISLPTPILHTQISLLLPVTSPHHIILPWLRPKSSPNPSPNHPKYVNTIPHPPYTIQNNR